MAILEEKSFCELHGHHYNLASNPYRKVTGEKRLRFLPFLGMKRDKSTRYVTLFCNQCGITKEILQVDVRFGLQQAENIVGDKHAKKGS